MSNYWDERWIDQYLNMVNHGEAELNKEIARLYKQTLTTVKSKLLDLTTEIQQAVQDGSLLVSDLYRFNRYYDFINSLNVELRKLGEKEIKVFTPQLTQAYNTYSTLLNKQMGLSLKPDEIAVRKAVEGIWCEDGLHWSDRIWMDKRQLQNRIEQGIIDVVASGSSPATVISNLNGLVNSRFVNSFNASSRLVRTELIHTYSEASKDKYNQAGIKKVQFKATTTDERTCEMCGDLDGQIFDLNNIPPIAEIPTHPNCRCCWKPVVDLTKYGIKD